MSLREGFKLAGMSAEIDFLRREKFSGEARYWMEGQELRRSVKIRETPNGSGPVAARDMTKETVESAFRDWLYKAETELKIFFSGGSVREIER
jgi:hypothetical protein